MTYGSSFEVLPTTGNGFDTPGFGMTITVCSISVFEKDKGNETGSALSGKKKERNEKERKVQKGEGGGKKKMEKKEKSRDEREDWVKLDTRHD